MRYLFAAAAVLCGLLVLFGVGRETTELGVGIILAAAAAVAP